MIKVKTFASPLKVFHVKEELESLDETVNQFIGENRVGKVLSVSDTSTTDDTGASIGIIGLIIGLYSITNTPANILFGRLIERIGYRVPLIAGLIGDALGMFLYSVCRLPVHLALVRALHGTTGGMVGPATMSIIADYSDEAKKGRAMGFYGMSLAAATS